jgi:hypothetical protein
MPFFVRAGLLTGAVRGGERMGVGESWGGARAVSVGLGVIGYVLLYPLEVVNVRMSAEVER